MSTPGPTLHLMCGLPCSGKTTAARAIEPQQPALRLTPDEWIQQLYGDAVSGEALDGARDPVERVLWQLAEQVLVLGVDVILDFGFWSRAEREEFRQRAAGLGGRSELHFMDVPEAELLRRLEARNAEPPAGTFWVSHAQLQAWSELFEPPEPGELRPRDP